MNEELDKMLKELNENITRFKKMIGSFQQMEKRLDDTASKMADLRRELEAVREKPSPDWEQTAQAGLDRLEQEQHSLQDHLQRLGREIQTVKASKQSDQEQRQSQYQALKDEVSPLGQHLRTVQADLARLEQHRHDTQSLLQNMPDQLQKTLSAQQRWIYTLAAFVGILMLVVVCLAVYNLSGNTTAPAEKPSGDKQAMAERHTSDPVPLHDPSPQAPAPAAGEQVPAGPTIPAESRTPGLMSAESAEKLIKDRSGFALTYLKHANFARLAAKYIHPEKGVRFFPMGLSVSGKSFSVQVLPDATRDPTKHTWADAGGQPAIEATFSDYFKKYIYDQDFLSSTQARCNSIALPGKYGLSAGGIAAQFPGCIFVEYLKNGRSLVLVFERFDGPGVWYLVGVVHGE